MTKQQFRRYYYQNLYGEIEFLYYTEFMKWQNSGKSWWSFPKVKEHCNMFKAKLLAHVYSKRDWDLTDFSY
jgi:hypothetical protein